jgi:hypothetical protein
MRVTIATSSHWSVTIGKDYDVLEVDILLDRDSDERVLFRVVGDDGNIQYISSSIVEMVPGYSTPQAIFPAVAFLDIPPGWVLEIRDRICSIGPREITGAGYRGICSFWEDFYDSVGDAKWVVASLLRERHPECYKRFRSWYGDLAAQ